VNLLSTFSDRKSCNTSTTLQNSIAQFVSDSGASCLFQQTNGLCTCITKIVIIFFKNKAAFYKRRSFVNILCYIMTIVVVVVSGVQLTIA